MGLRLPLRHRIDDHIGHFAIYVFQTKRLAVKAMLMVAAGGALGSVARYGLNLGVVRTVGDTFPWGILVANILGCFAMGVASSYLFQRMPQDDAVRLFITTGFLGGFTTFSAFSYDALKLINNGQISAAAFYVFASVGLSLLGVFAGFAVLKAALT